MIKNRNSLMNQLSFFRPKLLLILFLVFQYSVFGQGKQISGIITDETGETLPGVNVTVKGTTIGTISSIDGAYSIVVENENAELVFSFVGFLDQTISTKGNSTIDVTLKEDVFQLNEVVAIGYGVQKKKLNTGSSVNFGGDEIQKLNTTSAIDALKGVSAGVNITQGNGQPGTDAKVYIRGIGTTGNSAPLYIVDGVATGNITHLAPSDIESIDILKDAASAAIYGSRAANGVILVTTKTGKKSKRPTITYDFYHGWHSAVNLPEMLNAQQYIEIMDEANENDAIASGKTLRPIKWASLLENYAEIESGEWTGTNWLDEIIDDEANVESHSVNITGGSDMSTYSMGFSHLTETGIIGKGTNNTYKRINMRLNSDHSLIKSGNTDILRFGESLTFTNTSNPNVRTGNIYWNDLHNALVASPVLPMYATNDDDPAYPYHFGTDWFSGEANPIANMIINGNNNENTNNSIIGRVYAELQPIKNLVFRSSYGINAWFGNSRSYTTPYELSSNQLSTVDNVRQSMSQGYTWTFTNTLAYNYAIGNHSISALVGTEAIKNSQSLELKVENEGNVFGDWEHAYIDNASTITTNTTISGKDTYGWGMLSYFGRLSYDLNEKYLLTAVIRADGSSKFTEGNKWGYFPSFSAGWVASNEEFMNNISSVNFLKIRGSWGQNGNQDIADFQFLSTLSYTDAFYYFGTDKTVQTLGSYPARVPNGNIKWETSEQIDLGFDIHFIDSKLQLNFDWYQKNTRDWLVLAPALASFGTNPAYINGGSVRNQGIEMVTTWQDHRGDFQYNANLSLSYNQNEVIDIQNDEKIIHGANNVLSQGIDEIFRAEVGFPIGYFRGYETNGILQNEAEVSAYVNPETGLPYFSDSKPGDVRFVDQNGDGLIDNEDKIMIGNPNPDFILGFQIGADYKGAYIQLTNNGMFGPQIAKSNRS